MNTFTLSFRLLIRQGRSGALLMLLVALAVATAALAAVGLFTDRVGRALEANAHEVLAADLVVASRQALPDEFRAHARSLGLDTAQTITLSTVVFHDDTSLLVDVKAVEPGYPLRGRLRIGDVEQRVTDAIPEPGTAWVEPQALRGLDAHTGDRLEVGREALEIAEVLAFEPDRGGGGLAFLAPRVMINAADLERAGLLGPGARASFRLLISGEPSDVADYATWAEAYAQAGQRLLRIDDAEAGTGTALEQARRFLSMAALTAVILAAVAVLLAARQYSNRQRDLVALMRCYGAGRGRIFGAITLLLLWLVVAAIVLGLSAGVLAQAVIAELLAGGPAGELPPARIAPGLWAGLFTATLAAGFALPALLSLGGVPPMRILNRALDRQHPGWRLAYGLAIVCAITIPAWQLGDWRLTAILLGGSLALAVVLAVAGFAAMLVARRTAIHVGPAWRIGVSGLDRRRGAGIVQITALGLGLMALLLLLVVRGELLDQWRGSLPEGTPNHFLVNVQSDQLEPVRELLGDADGLQLRPMATGRLVTVNGRPVGEIESDDALMQRRLQGPVNLSWSEHLPAANHVIAGQFWDTSRAPDEISLAANWADSAGLSVGDQLTFQIGERELGGRVTSLREVEWDSFNVNFFILITPEAAQGVPHQHIGSFYLPPAHTDTLRELTRRYPNISLLDTEAILDRVREIIDRVSQAAQVVFLFTLAAGVMVLLTALQSTRDERQHEAALIRTLGADDALVLRSLLVEYAVMALIAGTLAAVGAAITGWFLARELFDFAYHPSPMLFLLGLGGGLLLVVGAGWLGNRSVLRTPPVRILRAG